MDLHDISDDQEPSQTCLFSLSIPPLFQSGLLFGSGTILQLRSYAYLCLLQIQILVFSILLNLIPINRDKTI